MNDNELQVAKDKVIDLIKKAADTKESGAALHLSQAALNAANALCALNVAYSQRAPGANG